jgi:flagellar motor switch protein FliM
VSAVSDQSLSTDQIAELFEAADRGELPDGENRRGQRAKRVRPVDFTRPIKFTPEQIRRIKQAVDRFCQAGATTLTAELRVPVEVELIDSAQLTWWDAHLQLSKDSINATVEMESIGTRMLWSVELAFILTAIENLLGGLNKPPKSRRLSDVDRRLALRVVDGLVGQLTTPWQDLARVPLTVGDFDTSADDAQLASASEPTLVLVLELRLGSGSHTLTMLIPYGAIHPVEDAILGRDESAAGAQDPRIAQAVNAVLHDVDVTLRAAAPSVELPIDQVLGLKPGDVLRLGAPVSRGVTIYADDQPVHRGAPGRNGVRRAVQVLGPAEEAGP